MGRFWRRMLPVLAAVVCSLPFVQAADKPKVSDEFEEYATTTGVTGAIKVAGSDSMLNLVTLWAEGYAKFYPNVQKELEGKGTSSGPPALTEGTVQFASMSREMKSSEIEAFQSKHGYKPTALATSIDMLAVYVHKDNPIKGLSLKQVDAIFSKNRKGGYSKDIRTWGELGLKGEWAAKPVTLYGRNSASGTYGFFKEKSLFGGDYKDSVKEMPGSSAVVASVAKEKYAIGYSGIGYKTADVIAVPLSIEEGEDFIPAESDYGYSGEYPLTRDLYLYINYKPGSKLDPLRREFIRYIFSKEGQTDVIEDGYLAVLPQSAADTLKSVGISTSK